MHDAPSDAPPAVARGSACADSRAAECAIDLAAPLLEAAACHTAINQSGVVHVVILDPALTPANATFEQAILLEASFGLDRARWDADYAGFARAKARLSWETGLDSQVVLTQQPQRLRRGDTLLGGAVVLDGIVVSISGCEAMYDEALAGSVALLLRAAARQTVMALGGRSAVP
ncbi:hypothetical protein [Solimonas soli]|uniref:hypothetical protein n=1 Tax=Solimonas soli TaxID=413479 RepID=UPI0004BCF795|nr:hypothetical protein [Solimonas soli]